MIIPILAALVLALWLLLRPGGGDAPAWDISTNEGRVDYLGSLGWQVDPEPVESQGIIIPKEFTAVYEDYNSLQLSQGFDLTKYAGREAVRYTYRITNYPTGDNTVVADIVICDGTVVAGDVQSVAKDGFMQGLQYPEK